MGACFDPRTWKKTMKSILFFILALSFLPVAQAKAKEGALSSAAPLAIPGQVEKVGNLYKIYLEDGLWAEWAGSRILLKSPLNPSLASADLAAPAEKMGGGSSLGGGVEEQDLGGGSKKKPPLAHKNPKFRDIQVPRGGDPFKASGKKPMKVSEEKTDDGTTTTTEYPDGSKSLVFVSPSLKEESAFNQKGDVVWRNLEGSVQGLNFKKTQWEDGSRIWEYSNPKGTFSIQWDQD